MISYAQNFEDVILERIFSKCQEGFYVDVGAAEPTIHSVTRHFYDKGWHGINIEPSGSLFLKLSHERTRDINLNLAVTDTPGIVKLYDIPNTGLSTLVPEYLSSFNSLELTLDYDGNTVNEINEIQVQCETLSNILKKYTKKKRIEFLKIDTEGSELSVIKSNDWKQFRPVVVVVEATVPNSTQLNYMVWDRYLIDADYIFTYFDGLNRFYLSSEWKSHFLSLFYPPSPFDHYVPYGMIQLKKEIDVLEKMQFENEIKKNQLINQVDNLRQQLELVSIQLYNTQENLDRVLSSRSWHYTKSLRWIESMAHKIAAFLIRK